MDGPNAEALHRHLPHFQLPVELLTGEPSGRPLQSPLAHLRPPQVTISNSPPPQPFHSHPVTPAYGREPQVVRVQLHLLDETVPDETQDVNSWTLAHLLHTYVDPLTSEERVRVRFVDGRTTD